MKYLNSILLVALTALVICCNPGEKSIDFHYPAPFPDTAALTFLPKLVSTDSFDFNACFSPDGKSYYFTRNEKGKTLIYAIQHDGSAWGNLQLTSFTDTAWSQADPAFSPDGKMYFISNRPKNASDTLKDFDIWFSTPLEKGGWSAPENFIAINTDSNEYYISFTETGDMYFGSSRPGGYGQEDIYVSRFANSEYAMPENLGPVINTKSPEFDPFIFPDGKRLIFASSKRAMTVGMPVGGTDLFITSQFEKDLWQIPENLGPDINTPTRDFCPYVSPDGKYFFFSSEANVKWIGIDALKR